MAEFETSRWADPAYTQEYLDEADHYIPERRLLLSIVASYFRYFVNRPGPKRVLDLGCGDGIVGALISATDPDVHLTSVDGSELMLEAAGKRLAGRNNVSLQQATFQQLIDGSVDLGPFDFVVSAFAIHHLRRAQVQALFGRIFAMLDEPGHFVNMDIVLPSAPDQAEWYEDLWSEWIWRHEQETELGESYVHTAEQARDQPENFYDTLAFQLDALSKAGFAEAECHYRHGIFGIYSGSKRSSATA